MAVKLVPMTCPNCKATIEIDTTKDFCFCTYCGTKILVNDDSTRTVNINAKIDHRYTERNETEIERIKSNERADIRKFKAKENDNKSSLIIFIVMAALVVIGGVYLGLSGSKAHKEQVAHFEQLSQEIAQDIEDGNYAEARLKANQIHYTANYRSGEEEKWDEVRETLLEEIAKAENGGELPKETLGDKISNIFKKDE